MGRARLHNCHFSSGRLQAALGPCAGPLAMLSDGEPKYKRPRRLCIGVSRDKGKPIYAEGFGEWKRTECTFLVEDSDDSLPDNGFEVKFHHETLFWWAWNWNEVVAEEEQIAEEEDHWQEEAMHHQREEEELLRHLIALPGSDCRENK